MALIEQEAAIAKVEPDEYYHSNEVRAMLEDLPTIAAAPVVHGRWIDSGEALLHCSACGAYYFPYNYCPNCGARMDGGEGHED